MINSHITEALEQGFHNLLKPKNKPCSIYVRSLNLYWEYSTAVQLYVQMPEHWHRIPVGSITNAVLQHKIDHMFECTVSLAVQRMLESEQELVIAIRNTLLSEISIGNHIFYEADSRTGMAEVKPALLFDPPSGIPIQDTCSICAASTSMERFVWGGGNLQWVHAPCLWRLYQESGAMMQSTRH